MHVQGFVDRIYEEKQQLDDRLVKLQMFIGTNAFSTLPRSQQKLMYAQVTVMREYVDILVARLVELNVTDES